METNPPGANRPLTNLAQSYSHSMKANSATLLFWVISNFKSNTMVSVKVHETFDFPEIESVTIFCFCLKSSKKTVVLIWICYQAIFFRGKSADASQTKREEGAADRRLNQNLPRLRWSRRESMYFYKSFRTRSKDKTKKLKIKTTTKTFSFVQLWLNCERRGKWLGKFACY